MEGDATEEACPVERDALAGEDEGEGEGGGAGVAVVEGMEEADVEIGAFSAGDEGERPRAVRCALGQAGIEAAAGVGADAVAFPALLVTAGKLRTAAIVYEARRAGVPLVFVDPAYSSKACTRCGHVDRLNRISQAEFVCRSCGVGAYACRNASHVLARRGERVDCEA
ncbi:hypothetical protein AAW14_00530 [Streptomyces hygroscopicus]|uniref:zinc ribbon domain-containing protein n=1 Tax=Streptomyces hygroscopicus TaxID=1912 RepID=UPI003A0FFF2B|nr:hypothetical protein [Streptomyces hygroscopicus]